MAHYEFSASAFIQATASDVYAILADYRDGHPRILPKPPFVSLVVEQGGIGAGTVFQCQMRLLGRLQTFRATVSEPEPGRVLMETIAETGIVTTFTVEPGSEEQTARATIRTKLTVRAGVLGRIEGWLAESLLKPAYRKELGLLADVAAKHAAR